MIPVFSLHLGQADNGTAAEGQRAARRVRPAVGGLRAREQRAAARRRARCPAGGRTDPAGRRAQRGRRRGVRVAADPGPGRPGRAADGDADDGAGRPRDRGARAAPAQRRHRADRHRRAGRGPDRGGRRPRGGDLRPPAARHRLRPRAELPAAPARVPVDRAADQGRGDEPPVDRRGLRRGDARLPGGLRHLAHRAVGPGADRLVRPADDVRDPLRAVDGLRGLPAQRLPRALERDARHRARRSSTASRRPGG